MLTLSSCPPYAAPCTAPAVNWTSDSRHPVISVTPPDHHGLQRQLLQSLYEQREAIRAQINQLQQNQQLQTTFKVQYMTDAAVIPAHLLMLWLCSPCFAKTAAALF
jgi:hypothetical protein